MRRKISGATLKKIILVVLALAVAGFSTLGLKSWATQNQELEKALVASRDMPSYTVITSDDVGWKDVPKGSVDANAIQDTKQVVNKMTAAPLYKGEQIRPERLNESPLMIGPGEVSIGVPVNALRAVGMTIGPGDVVDVLWVTGANRPAQCVASDAVVLDIRDSGAGSVVSQIRDTVDTTKDKKSPDPSIAILKIRHSESFDVANALSSGMLVLAKKEGGLTGGRALN